MNLEQVDFVSIFIVWKTQGDTFYHVRINQKISNEQFEMDRVTFPSSLGLLRVSKECK